MKKKKLFKISMMKTWDDIEGVTHLEQLLVYIIKDKAHFFQLILECIITLQKWQLLLSIGVSNTEYVHKNNE